MLTYTYPRVAIAEARKRPRAVNIGSLSRIGVVGSFAQGPFTPTPISTIDELVATYGEDAAGLTGHAFVQAAMAQGANDFVVVRAEGTGLEGAVQDADYVTALAQLETEKVAIVACAGQSSATIHNALLTHVANATVTTGLRVAVLTVAAGLDRAAAIAAKGALTSARAMLCYLHQQIDDEGTLWAPDGYIAGVLATNAPNQSPSNVLLQGTLGAERKLTEADLDALFTANMIPVGAEPQGGVAALTGLMLDGSAVSERRILDQIETDLFKAVQWAKSLPMIDTDRPGVVNVKTALEDQVDSYLRGLVDRGWIDSFLPTQVTKDAVQKRWTVLVRPALTADGDYIDLTVEY